MEGRDITKKKILSMPYTFLAGLAGTIVVLFDGNNLVIPILPQKGGFKAKNGFRETCEVKYELPTPHVYIIPNITTPEIITEKNLSNYFPNILHTTIQKLHKSPTWSLFVPDIPLVQENNWTEKNISISARAHAMNYDLQLAEVEFGPRVVSNDKNIVTYVPHNDFPPGWARYPKMKKNIPISSLCDQLLHTIYKRKCQKIKMHDWWPCSSPSDQNCYREI